MVFSTLLSEEPKEVWLEGEQIEALYLWHMKQYAAEFNAGNLEKSKAHEDRAEELKSLNARR